MIFIQNNGILQFSLILFLFISCNIRSNKEGFSESGKVNYSVKYLPTNSYPTEIDQKISNEPNRNFSDSLRKRKAVFIVVRYNYESNSKKVKNIDTLGYFVSIRNDLSALFWEIDFDSDLRIKRSEEITFQKRKQYEEEGRKIVSESN